MNATTKVLVMSLTSIMLLSCSRPKSYLPEVDLFLSKSEQRVANLVTMLDDDPSIQLVSLSDVGYWQQGAPPLTEDRLKAYRSLLADLNIQNAKVIRWDDNLIVFPFSEEGFVSDTVVQGLAHISSEQELKKYHVVNDVSEIKREQTTLYFIPIREHWYFYYEQ